ncbi:MAG: hypothetical protein J6K32_10720 [Clostridia bacterium]|nr:hypothetical protein [Clostridia bacterium]
MKKLLSVVLVLLLCMSAVTAGAQTIEKDGLKVTFWTDKTSYKAGETVNLTLSVENRGTAVIKDIRAEYVLSGAFVASADNAANDIGMLGAGKQATLKASFVVGAGDEAPDLPDTGDSSSLLLWAALLGISGLAFAKLSRCAQRRVMALLLCAVTAGGVMLCGIDAANAEGDLIAIELPGPVPSDEECRKMYDLVMSKAGTNPGGVLDTVGGSVTLTEEIEIMGRKTEVTVTVAYSNPSDEEYAAAYVKDKLEYKPLSQTISSTHVMYNETIGDGVRLPESFHEYSSDTDQLYILNGEAGTQAISICFDSRSQTENRYDALLIYDGAGNYLTTLTGTALKNAVVHVPGARAYLRLVSDWGFNYYGFKVEKAVPHQTPVLSGVVNDGNGALRVNWSVPYGYEGYILERAYMYGSTMSGYSTIRSGSAEESSYLDMGVTEGSVYDYRYAPTFTHNSRSYYYVYSQSVRNMALRTTTLTSGTPSLSSSTPKVTLKWTAVPYAASYEVYRSTAQNGSYTKVGTTSSTTYVDTPPSKTMYSYKVRLMAQADGVNYYSTYSVPQRYGYANLTAPGYLNGFSIAYNAVRLRWPSVTDAQKYEIYSSTRRNGTYTKVAETNLLTLAVPAQKGCYNFYKIRAYTVQDGRKVYSPYSRIFRIWPLAKPNTMHTITDENGVMTLQWKKIEGARQYTIYYSQSGRSGTFTELGTTTRASMSLASLPKDWTSCYIQIIAHRTDDGVRSRSAFSVVYRTVLNLKPPTNAAIGSINGSRVSSKWTAAANATGYEIYGSSSQNGVYRKLASTSGTSINHNVYRANSLNYIKVRTYVKQTNKVLTSAFSESIGIFPLAAPTNFSYSINSPGSVTIRWKAVPNAQSYHIYYSTSESGPFTRYGSTTATSKTLNNMPEGTIYIKLRAQRTDGAVRSYGAYSSVFPCNTDPRQFRALHVFIENDGVNSPMVVGDADMRRMRELYDVATPYGLAPSLVLDKRNLTKSQLFAQIASMASMADSHDITYFSLSCHGYSGKSTGTTAGALRLANRERLYIYELANELKKIPGQVIVQLNSCGSGSAILAAGGEAEPFDGEAFEAEIIEAFARADEECIAEAGGAIFGGNMVEDAHGEMRVNGKFYVITHCEAGQNGVHWLPDNRWPYNGQFLTIWMRSAVLSDSITVYDGINYNSRTKYLGSYAADKNGDKIVTLKEMGDHLQSLGDYFGYFEVDDEYMKLMPQVYPENSTFQLFKRR